jgi:hypothetical protein
MVNQEEEEGLVVLVADAGQRKRTVVVHLWNAFSRSAAMMSSLRLPRMVFALLASFVFWVFEIYWENFFLWNLLRKFFFCYSFEDFVWDFFCCFVGVDHEG